MSADHYHHDHDHDHDHYHDHDHDHDHDHHHGDGKSMSVLLTNSDSESSEVLGKLAETVFVEFSAKPQAIMHGQTLCEYGRHFQLSLEGREEYEFPIALNDDQTIAIFASDAPAGLNLTLTSKGGEKIKPIASQSFHGDHSHDSKVSSTSAELPGSFDGTKLNAWLDEFLQENGENVYRMKGVVAIAGQDYKFVFQGVHMIFGSQPAGEWGDEEPFNRLVFIGKNLDEDYIQDSLKACLA